MKLRKLANVALVAVLTATSVTASLTYEGRSKQSTAVAAATPKRHIAMKYNYAQRGDRYQWGGTGPSTWDCSGIVYMSYKKAGITLPRTTYDMIKSSKLSRTYHPKWGDIVFTSSGHVEMYVQSGWMHGAHHSGTRVGYTRIYKGASGYPRYYHVKGAG